MAPWNRTDRIRTITDPKQLYEGHLGGKQRGKGLAVKRLGVLSKTLLLEVALGLGVLSPPPRERFVVSSTTVVRCELVPDLAWTRVARALLAITL